MKVRCERDKTTFEATPEPYPGDGRQTKFYDKKGDRRIVCPTCGRAYFFYNGGTDVGKRNKGLWFADRPLTILTDCDK